MDNSKLYENVEDTIDGNGLSLQARISLKTERVILLKKYRKYLEIIITDMDCDAELEEADFSSLVDYYVQNICQNHQEEHIDVRNTKVYIHMKNSQKVFKNLKKLKLSEMFNEIKICNLSFPNVRRVIVKSIYGNSVHFKNDSILVTSNGMLLNTFCLSKEETLNLSNVASIIDNGAFKGCAAVKIKDINRFSWNSKILDGYIYSDASPFVKDINEKGEIIFSRYSKTILSDVICQNCTFVLKNTEHIKVIIDFICHERFNEYIHSLNVTVNMNISSHIDTELLISLFDKCSLFIKNIFLSENNNYYCIEDNVLYTKNKKTLIRSSSSKSGDFIVPDGVEYIYSYAFYHCNLIKSIHLPDTIKSIDRYAFSQMERLELIHFGKGIERLDGFRCFHKNVNIKEIELPGNIKHIGSEAFSYCLSLEKIKFNEGLETISEEAFSNIAAKEIELPDTVKSIGNNAFKFVDKLTINTKSNIIQGLMNSFLSVKFVSSSLAYTNAGKTIKDIQTGKTFYFPCYLDNAYILNTLEYSWNAGICIEQQPIKLADIFPNNFFVLYSLFKDNRDSRKLKNMLHSKESKIIQSLIKTGEFSDEDFISIVQGGFISEKGLKYLLKNTNDVTKRSYIMDALYKYDSSEKYENFENI